MASLSAASSSIQNRAPVIVTVRSEVTLSRHFEVVDKKKVQAYVDTQGCRSYA